MAASPPLKVHNPQGEYVASCKHYEDAAMIVAAYGDGAKIKHVHGGLLWHEGCEEISASESYDRAAQIMAARPTTRPRR